jgi:NADH/NAD ratio-sensing transcriptional regulator Rex
MVILDQEQELQEPAMGILVANLITIHQVYKMEMVVQEDRMAVVAMAVITTKARKVAEVMETVIRDVKSITFFLYYF